jgi:hypothetical protein
VFDVELVETAVVDGTSPRPALRDFTADLPADWGYLRPLTRPTASTC